VAFNRWVTAEPWDLDIPAKPGVYVFMVGREAVYIGQSNDLQQRLRQHNVRHGFGGNIITPWGDYRQDELVRVKYRVSRSLGDWAMWEIRLIYRLRPRFNQRYLGRHMKQMVA
jgi:excinuclease UvrABC nuclease subunit